MSRKSRTISYAIAIYNEEHIVLESVKTLLKKLTEIFGRSNFEIILVDNGSTDGTLKVLKTLENSNIRVVTIKNKGHGLALRKGIEHARYNAVVLTAIDLPFGFSDLEQFITKWNSYDMIFGSKAHPESKIQTTAVRAFSSLLYRILVKNILHIPIKDPQGTIFLKKNKVLPFLDFCDAKTAFFTTQLALYGTLYKLNICEVPVFMSKDYARKSKYNVLTDGSKILYSLLKEMLKKKGVEIKHSENRST